ncbi:TetR/AcrR family transcriptional regulator [Nonomuraea salmonea]|uniref:TetR/AcrR family transcriptional regulator n=1 Tax=Nonomuraea salmonea TaxID=46181 RepID=UPI003CD089D7
MGVPARRLPVSEVRRAQITSATIVVLARRGFAGTSYDAICRQAGLSSKRLISYHFADKEELLATVARVVREEEAAFIRRAASGGSRGCGSGCRRTSGGGSTSPPPGPSAYGRCGRSSATPPSRAPTGGPPGSSRRASGRGPSVRSTPR